MAVGALLVQIILVSKLALIGPKTIPCAVMSVNSVNIEFATKRQMFADYKGRRYFFCCGACPKAFKNDPAKFVSRPSIPIPKIGQNWSDGKPK